MRMAAQIKNTLRSLLPPYQRGVEMNDYEIILIDNGSAKILDEEKRIISPNMQGGQSLPSLDKQFARD